MLGTTIADLAVLGITQREARTADRILLNAKALSPEFWQPGVSVIEVAIERNLEAGRIERRKHPVGPDRFSLTPTGAGYLDGLLRYDPAGPLSPAILALEAAQLCFLDAAGVGTKYAVLGRLQASQKRKVTDLTRRFGTTEQGEFLWDLQAHLARNHLENLTQALASLSPLEAGPDRFADEFAVAAE